MLVEASVVGGVVLITAVLYMMGMVGTKETSFEDAVANQKQRQKDEAGGKNRKYKGGLKKIRAARSRVVDASVPASSAASSDNADTPEATTEDETNDDEQQQQQQQQQQLLLQQQQQQQLERQQRQERQQQERLERQQERHQQERQRQQERQKQQQERQKQQQELQQQHERQKQLEKEQKQLEKEQKKQQQQERENQKEMERQKELDRQKELERQEELERQKEAVEQLRQQQIIEQETKRNERKKKQEEYKQKLQKGQKAAGSVVTNGVAVEATIEVDPNADMLEQKPTKPNNKKQAEKVDKDKKPTRKASDREEPGTISPAPKEDSLDTDDKKIVAINGVTTNNVVKKNKKNAQKSDKGSISGILKSVENAQLSSDQLQSMVESLLAMAADGGWSLARKGTDGAMSKKLEDAQNIIADHHEAQSALTTKISDLRTDLNSERSRSTQLRKQIEGTAVEQQRVAEKDAQQQQQKQALHQHTLQQLQDDRNRLQRDYEEKITQMEAARLESQHASREEAAQQVSQQQHAALQRIQEMQHETQQVQFQLDSVSREKSDVDNRLHTAQQEIVCLSSTIDTHTHHIHSLQQEKETLETLASESVRPAADGQENNADAAAAQEQLLAEKKAELEEQAERVSHVVNEVNRLQYEVENHKKKNDELRNKNRTVLEALKNTEDRLQMRDQTASETLRCTDDGYRQLLMRLHPDITVEGDTETCSFMQQFEAAAQKQQQQQQEESQKKEKEVEVVEVVVEKVVQDPLLQSRLEELEAQNKTLSEKTSSLEESLSSSQRSLASAEQERGTLQQQLKQLQQQEPPAPVEDTERVDKLSEDNRQLQEKVINYQTVLDNTESLLTTLQASVEGEEAKWLLVVQEKEERLTHLTKDNDRLSKELDQQKPEKETNEKLQGELEEAKQTMAALQDQLAAMQKEKARDVAELTELVAVGQESGKEQELIIAQLHTELQTAKSACTINGPPSTEAANDESSAEKQ